MIHGIKISYSFSLAVHCRVDSKAGRGGEFPSNHSVPSTAIKWKLCSLHMGVASGAGFSCASTLLPCESVSTLGQPQCLLCSFINLLLSSFPSFAKRNVIMSTTERECTSQPVHSGPDWKPFPAASWRKSQYQVLRK